MQSQPSTLPRSRLDGFRHINLHPRAGGSVHVTDTRDKRRIVAGNQRRRSTAEFTGKTVPRDSLLVPSIVKHCPYDNRERRRKIGIACHIKLKASCRDVRKI